MPRLRGEDSLSDVRGQLGRAFRNATLATLQMAFMAATSRADQPAAAIALNEFHQAARKLNISENAFNQRARARNGDKPTLLTHLRTPEQFAAMRDFSAAKETLLGFNSAVGRHIVNLVTRGAETTKSPRRQTTAGLAVL